MDNDRHSLLALLLLALCLGCSTAADDDDSSDDDDDATAPPDVEYEPCLGPSVTWTEQEPNDGGGVLNLVETDDGDVLILGTASSCSNDGTYWTGDRDVFGLSFGCGGEAHFTLSWNEDLPEENPSDLDLFVFDATSETAVVASASHQPLSPSGDPVPPLESGTAETGGELRLEVLCWQGPSADYSVRVQWPASSGDDDDSGELSDDDDSANNAGSGDSGSETNPRGIGD